MNPVYNKEIPAAWPTPDGSVLHNNSRGGAERRKEEGGDIFENGRKCEKTLYFHPNSKKNLYISSPKIGENLIYIFFQNLRKLCPNFPKQEGDILPQPPLPR
jgi:hypothetical protein